LERQRRKNLEGDTIRLAIKECTERMMGRMGDKRVWGVDPECYSRPEQRGLTGS